MTSLLPPNATDLERNAEAAINQAIEQIDVPLRTLWNPAICPLDLLPWLAWALSVDEWDSSWTEATKRAVLAASVEVHRHKGTTASLRSALVAMGYEYVEILESVKYPRDGTYVRDGSINHGAALQPYEFDVALNAGEIPSPEKAAKIITQISRYKNARSHLKEVRYMELHHNGLHLRDGSQKHNGGLIYG
ncbi:MAG: phage tail protein I [Candidatus Sedimenticola sp. (ex Thyasira tokunagai)]